MILQMSKNDGNGNAANSAKNSKNSGQEGNHEQQTSLDVISKANSKQYLTMCLIQAHAMNAEFQRVMGIILGKYDKFQSARVKLYQRCNTTAQIEYSDRDYPSTANIADYLRCLVTCETPGMLLPAVDDVISRTAKECDENDHLIDVFRLKNGVQAIESWNQISDGIL